MFTRNLRVAYIIFLYSYLNNVIKDGEDPDDTKGYPQTDNDVMEMKPFLSKDIDVKTTNHSNGKLVQENNSTDDEKLQEECKLLEKVHENVTMNTNAVVEPIFKIQVEPPSSNSNSGQIDVEIKTKSYVEFQSGQVKYPPSESDSQSPGSIHKISEAGNDIVEKDTITKVTFEPPNVNTVIEKHNGNHNRFRLRRSSSCGKHYLCSKRYFLSF